MKLADYLRLSNISASEFARRCGTTRQNVYRWTNGLSTPSRKHLWAIQAVTQGAVTTWDFLGAPPNLEQLSERPDE